MGRRTQIVLAVIGAVSLLVGLLAYLIETDEESIERITEDCRDAFLDGDADFIVAHLDPDHQPPQVANAVDGHNVPVPHFGVLLAPDDWNELAARLTAAGTQFVVEPYTRFEGRPGEQSTMFLLDPAGNALEFKSFADDAQVFAT